MGIYSIYPVTTYKHIINRIIMHKLSQEDIEALDIIGTKIDYLLSRPQTILVKILIESIQKTLIALYYISNE